jgi:hypothetical protein
MFKQLLIKCLSSSDEVSFGRTMSAIAFLACILWDTFFVALAAYKLDFHFMTIHDVLPTNDQLLGQVKFCAACYCITKISDCVSMFRKDS